MIEAILRTPVPMPEADALAQAPVKWDLGKGHRRIRMAVPLFTFATLELFNLVTRAIKFRLAAGEELTLSRMLAHGESDDESVVNDMIAEALQRFYDEYKFLPQNLADLIIALSSPINEDETREILDEWGVEKGLGQFSSKGEGFWNPAKDIQGALMLYAKHTVSIASCIHLLEQLKTLQTDVKKKLLEEQAAPEAAPKSPFQKALSHSLPRK